MKKMGLVLIAVWCVIGVVLSGILWCALSLFLAVPIIAQIIITFFASHREE